MSVLNNCGGDIGKGIEPIYLIRSGYQLILNKVLMRVQAQLIITFMQIVKDGTVESDYPSHLWAMTLLNS